MNIELIVPVLACANGIMLLRRWGKSREPMVLTNALARVLFGAGYLITSVVSTVGSLQWLEPGAVLLFLLELSNHLLQAQAERNRSQSRAFDKRP